jgi:hypothetical protein
MITSLMAVTRNHRANRGEVDDLEAAVLTERSGALRRLERLAERIGDVGEGGLRRMRPTAHRLVKDERYELRAREHAAHERAERGDERLQRVVDLRRGRKNFGCAKVIGQHGFVQADLAPEVVVDHPLVDPGAGDDRVHPAAA